MDATKYDYNVLGTWEEDIVEITKDDEVATVLKGYSATKFMEMMNRIFDECDKKYRHTAYWICCDEAQQAIKNSLNKQEV